MNSQDRLRKKARPLFSDYIERQTGIELISLSTSDGFPVHSAANPNIGESFQEDKMAAAASTLQSVSNAVSKQILARDFQMTFIETDKGNVVFVLLRFDSQEYVLSMSANNTLNIANLRILIKRIAKEISCSKETQFRPEASMSTGSS